MSVCVWPSLLLQQHRCRFNGTGGDVGTGTRSRREEAAAAGPTPAQDQNSSGLQTCTHRHTDTHTPSAPSVWASPPAMRDYSATPSNGGACMPCCQVCVFAFTAFLIVAERTARESYLGHTHTHTHTLTHKHTPSTFINEVCVLCDWLSFLCGGACLCYLTLLVCARVCAATVRMCACVRVCVWARGDTRWDRMFQMIDLV